MILSDDVISHRCAIYQELFVPPSNSVRMNNTSYSSVCLVD